MFRPCRYFSVSCVHYLLESYSRSLRSDYGPRRMRTQGPMRGVLDWNYNLEVRIVATGAMQTLSLIA